MRPSHAHSLTFSSFTCLSSPIVLRRHSLAMTLGLIDAALLSTSLITESNFLQETVNVGGYLPFAELPTLGVKVALLEKAKVYLDGRADIAVRPREYDWYSQLLDSRSHLSRAVVRRIVQEHDRIVAP